MDCTTEQRKVIDAVINGSSIFLTGAGGTGKSFLLQTLYREYTATGKKMAVTAMTGCAALLLQPIPAKTLHSWAGIGLGTCSFSTLVDNIVKNGRKKKVWRETDCLVIDEVSMLTPELLDTLEKIGSIVRGGRRGNGGSSCFGGLQIVCIGDFYQLPPVKKEGVATSYVFESPIWNKVIQENFELKTIHRQKESVFQQILHQARRGELCPEAQALLLERKMISWKGQPIRPTLLFTRNMDVDEINQRNLEKLTGDIKTFEAETIMPLGTLDKFIGKSSVPNNEVNMFISKLDKDAPYSVILQLKEGAQVMLLTNLDQERGLVNGSRGVVKGFTPEGFPLVKFLTTLEPIIIKHHTWMTEKNIGRKQIPLRLAYALTIHKAQGMSLDSALIDIGPSTFEYGQAYVALSRVRSLEALYIYEFDPKSFRVHPAVKKFYDSMNA